jgi:hypothetical protein
MGLRVGVVGLRWCDRNIAGSVPGNRCSLQWVTARVLVDDCRKTAPDDDVSSPS